MASTLSFAGLSTNLPTDKLIQAIMDQASQPLVRMQDKQALNTKRQSVLRQVNAGMMALNTTVSGLASSSFLTRTVSSSDSTGAYVTATANGASVGTYDVKVSKIATKAQMTGLTGLATADTTSVGTGQYALKNMDGTTSTFTIDSSNNTLQGMRDAINGLNAGVQATIVNVGTGATPYKLILTATNTGTGTSDANAFTVAQISGTNSLGIASGTLSGGTTGDLTAGGTAANVTAQNAELNVNGVDLIRKSNTVTDAVDGMTLTLKAGGQATATTLTVATDNSTITKAMNDVATRFNSVLKLITDNTGADKALGNDRTVRNLLEGLRTTLTGNPGVADSNPFKFGASLGFKTNRDGTLSVDSSTFQAALDKNPDAAQAVLTGISNLMQTAVNRITSPGSGDLAKIIQGVDTQNSNLARQIESMQARLDRKQAALQQEFSALEETVGRLQSAGQSLSGLR